MDRRAAVKKLMDARDGALVITGLGSPSYDVHAAGDCDNNYYGGLNFEVQQTDLRFRFDRLPGVS